MTLLPDFWGIGVRQRKTSMPAWLQIYMTDLPLELGLPEQTGFTADTVAAGPQ